MVSPQATQDSKSSNRTWARGDRCPCGPQDRCRCDGTVIEQCGCYRRELIAQGQHSGDPVRITAEVTPAVRRQILREHYEKRAAYQKAVTLEAKTNRDALTARFRSNPESVHPCQIEDANRQLTTARTVEQDVRANLALYTDNREFVGQVAK